MTSDLRSSLELLRLAIRVKGPHPEFHDEAKRRVAKEWPTLWAAIGLVLLEYERVLNELEYERVRAGGDESEVARSGGGAA
jgi:hypothetical protein